MATVAELLSGRYELLECVGSGGMGTVHRAHDQQLDRDVAVKLPTLDRSGTTRERFRREARAAARLNHPNVVRVYDWDDRDGTAFLVMEYIDGPSLREVLNERGSLTTIEAARYGEQIADALAHAHSKGVVHRDVKPGNVLVAPDGTMKVTDFGIARATEADTITDPGLVVGTVGYLAPEQLRGDRVDGRSDVFSLGMLLATLTGSGGSALDAVIRRATAPDPADRYQTAAEMRDSLRDVARDQTIAAIAVVVPPLRETTVRLPSPPPPPPPPPPRLAPRPAPPRPAPPRPAPPPRPLLAPKSSRGPKPVKPLRPMKAKKQRKHPGLHEAPNPEPPRVRTRRRVWRARHLLAIVLPLLLIATIVAAGAVLVMINRPPDVPVPDVVNQDAFSAVAALNAAKFEVVQRYVDDPTPGGTVLRQDPRSGEQIEEGSSVVITVSRAQAMVPPVSGLMLDAAKIQLALVGFLNVTIVEEDRDDETPGTVLRSDPVAGFRSDKAGSIAMVVARDPYVAVPISVVGADEPTAINTLQALGLLVHKETQSSRTVAAGTVMSVSPGVGQEIRRGSTVSYKVSSGPRPLPVRNTVTQSRDDAVDDLEDAGFTVAVVLVPGSSSQRGRVISQSPNGGFAPEGSTVTINVGTTTR